MKWSEISSCDFQLRLQDYDTIDVNVQSKNTMSTGKNDVAALILSTHSFVEYNEQNNGSTSHHDPSKCKLHDEEVGVSQSPPNRNQNSRVLMRHVSLETLTLNPVHDSVSHKSSLVMGIVNLTARICGGGVLTLPLAFRKAGIIPTTVFMLFAVVSTDFSLQMLVECGLTGGRSYCDVAKAAFGGAAEIVTRCFMAVMLLGSLVAYSVLVMDLWSPIVLMSLPNHVRDVLMGTTIPTTLSTAAPYINTTMNAVDGDEIAQDNIIVPSKRASAIIVAGIMLLSLPLFLQRELHSLRHVCYVGFCSCILLMVAIVVRASQAVEQDNDDRQPINWFSTDIADLSFAFPIVIVCFLCCHNALGVHTSLVHPTRDRVKLVLDSSMMVCFVLFYLVGLGGYVYAMDETLDNIIMNFLLNDPMILVGRIGFCFTLFFGIPLVLLPCREAWLDIWPRIMYWKADSGLVQEFRAVDRRRRKGAHLIINGVDFDESAPLLVTDDPQKRHVTMLRYGRDHHMEHIVGGTADNTVDHQQERETLLCVRKNQGAGLTQPQSKVGRHSFTEDGDDQHDEYLADTMNDRIIHVCSTLAIMCFCYYTAISVPGVGFVWRLIGSSIAILIAFVVPSACYLKIHEHKECMSRSIAAWTLLIISLMAAPICTLQAPNQNT